MDPITIGAAISATKLLVRGAQDIGQITKSLDTVFHAKEIHEKNLKKPNNAIAQKNQGILETRAQDAGGATDLSTIANEVIQQKQLEASLKDLEREINRKYPVEFGKTKTWDVILETRSQRQKEEKERIKKKKERQKEEQENNKELWAKVWMWTWQSTIVLCFVGGLLWFLMWAAQKGGSL